MAFGEFLHPKPHKIERVIGVSAFFDNDLVRDMDTFADQQKITLRELFDFYIDRLYMLGTLARNGSTVTMSSKDNPSYDFELDALNPHLDKPESVIEFDKSPYLVYLPGKVYGQLQQVAQDLGTSVQGIVGHGIPLMHRISQDLSQGGLLIIGSPEQGLQTVDSRAFMGVA